MKEVSGRDTSLLPGRTERNNLLGVLGSVADAGGFSWWVNLGGAAGCRGGGLVCVCEGVFVCLLGSNLWVCQLSDDR